MGAFWRSVTNHSQLRWLGPDKGVIHLATAALVNAVWDLWAKEAGKPVWRLVADMTPEQIVGIVDGLHAPGRAADGAPELVDDDPTVANDSAPIAAARKRPQATRKPEPRR